MAFGKLWLLLELEYRYLLGMPAEDAWTGLYSCHIRCVLPDGISVQIDIIQDILSFIV